MPLVPVGGAEVEAGETVCRGHEDHAGKQESAVSVEWIAPANSRFNQPIVCQIVVRNNGQSPVHQVVVKPNLPTEVKIKASEPPIDPNNNDWSLGSLAPGQSKKVDVTLLSTRRGYQNYTANVTTCFDVSTGCASSCAFTFAGTLTAASLSGTYTATPDKNSSCPGRSGNVNAAKQ